MRQYHAGLWIRGRDGKEHAVHLIGATSTTHQLARLMLGELTKRGYTLRASEWRTGGGGGAMEHREEVDEMDWEDIPW